MLSKDLFIKATEEYNTFEKNVPAYYFRRRISSQTEGSARITIAACGFYELYWNGKRITKGLLSPYISNPDHYVYCDRYEVSLVKGENVVGILLGNGFQNNPGGYSWDFDRAPFRSAPAFALTVTQSQGKSEFLLADSKSGFKTAPSPIRSDDYRMGEIYDAREESEGWCEAGFDDSAWISPLKAKAPKGEIRLTDTEPIVKECEISPVKIWEIEDGFLYDFGISHAGICRLQIRGSAGQTVELRHADSLQDGDLNLAQIWFPQRQWERDRHIVHKDTYICKGIGTERYEPTFTYHGFRYVKVSGITAEQATPEALTFLVYHTRLKPRGDFECSDPIGSKLQEITKRSIVSNFHHFPTDCPQREKNGWTADAALSAEAAVLLYDPERNWREWLRNIRKAQAENGSLPGIIPTTGWGFHWGNGPAWDCVLVTLPYYAYLYRGETEMIRESVDSFLSYLKYLRSRCDENGLLSIGLGDWCHVTTRKPKAPLIVTDSIMAMDIAQKAAFLLDAIGRQEDAAFARQEAEQYRNALRSHLIDWDTVCVMGNCQSSQSMGLYYGVFQKEEEEKAFSVLLEQVHLADDHMDVGVLGGRVLFHVLSRFGESDLAWKMITREDFPSYGNWIKRGATTLWEDFLPDKVNSMNHHFWGDVSAWMIKRVAGLCLNPHGKDPHSLLIKPSFIRTLNHTSAYHKTLDGTVSVEWKRDGDDIWLTAEIPETVSATAELESGYVFEEGGNTRPLKSGTYRIAKQSKI